MKRIYVHIGMEKTGTTTLQAFLDANEMVLNRYGFTYFCNPKKTYFEGLSHLPIVAALNSELRSLLSYEKNQSLESLLDELRRDLGLNKKNVIISNEHFSSRLFTLEHLTRLKSVFDGYHVKVVCYIRRQDDLALASYTTGVLCGRRACFDLQEVDVGNRFFNFLEIIELWAAVFGRENVVVRKFDRQVLTGSDIRRDLLSIIGIHTCTEFAFGDDLNVSLDATQAEVLRVINQHLPDRESGGAAYDRAQLMRSTLIGFLPTGEPLPGMLNAADREVIYKRFRATNLQVERKFMAPGALADWGGVGSDGNGGPPKPTPVSISDLALLAARLTGALLDKELEIRSLHSSRIWRLMQPLRSLSVALSGLLKRSARRRGTPGC